MLSCCWGGRFPPVYNQRTWIWGWGAWLLISKFFGMIPMLTMSVSTWTRGLIPVTSPRRHGKQDYITININITCNAHHISLQNISEKLNSKVQTEPALSKCNVLVFVTVNVHVLWEACMITPHRCVPTVSKQWCQKYTTAWSLKGPFT